MRKIYECTHQDYITERKIITNTEIITQFYNTESAEHFEKRTGCKCVLENPVGYVFREWKDTFNNLGWKNAKEYIKNRMTSNYHLIEE